MVKELKDSLSGCEAKLQKTKTCLTSITSELDTTISEKAALKEEIELLASAKESRDKQLKNW
jgi:chromosome segregation ATPase